MDTIPSSSTVELLRPREVAEAAGVSERTVYLWLKAEMLRPAYAVRGEPLFTCEQAEAITRLAEQRRQVRDALKVPA